MIIQNKKQRKTPEWLHWETKEPTANVGRMKETERAKPEISAKSKHLFPNQNERKKRQKIWKREKNKNPKSVRLLCSFFIPTHLWSNIRSDHYQMIQIQIEHSFRSTLIRVDPSIQDSILKVSKIKCKWLKHFQRLKLRVTDARKPKFKSTNKQTNKPGIIISKSIRAIRMLITRIIIIHSVDGLGYCLADYHSFISSYCLCFIFVRFHHLKMRIKGFSDCTLHIAMGRYLLFGLRIYTRSNVDCCWLPVVLMHWRSIKKNKCWCSREERVLWNQSQKKMYPKLDFVFHVCIKT